jgi:hypothetical protein
VRTHLLAVLVLVALALPASAQTTSPESAWTFGGTLGYGRTWDDEGSIGSGWLLGGYADRRLWTKTDLELAVDILSHKRSDTFVADGTTTHVSAGLSRRFGNRSASGFVVGGGTVAFHDGTTGFSDGSFRTEHQSVNPGWFAGGGFAVRTGTNVEIGPVVRITMMQIDNDSDPWSTITAGLRIGFIPAR